MTIQTFYVQVTVHCDNLRISNQQDASSIQNFYFATKLYMFRASTVPIIRSYQLYTWQLVCFMQVMWPLPGTVMLQPDSPRQRPHNLHEIYQLPRVQLITPDDGHRRCPKHVEFRDKIKFWVTDESCGLFIRRLLFRHSFERSKKGHWPRNFQILVIFRVKT